MPPKTAQQFKLVDRLTVAIGKGDLDIIKAYLKQGVNVNDRDSSGWLPLHLITADTPSQIEIWRLLRTAGAKFLSSENESPLLKEDRLICPLGYYLKQRQYDLIDTILQDLYPTPGISTEQFPEIIVSEQGVEYPLLFYFILYGNLETLKALVDTLEDTSYLKLRHADLTPLMFAISHSLKEKTASIKNIIAMIFYLLSKGANPHETDENGKGVLHFLIAHGTQEDVEAFLEKHDPDLAHRDSSENTIIHYVAKYERLDLIDLFIEKGIDLNATNNETDTALIILFKPFTEDGYDEPEEISGFKMIKKLLAAGVDVDRANQHGCTGMSYAHSLDLYQTTTSMLEYEKLYKLFKSHSRISNLALNFEKNSLEVAIPLENLGQIYNKIRDAFKARYHHNVEKDFHLSSTKKQLKDILRQIENIRYLDYYALKLYRIVNILLTNNFNYKLKIHNRFPSKTSEIVEDYYYTFYKEKFVKLTHKNEETDIIIWSLMTSMVYHAGKYSWGHKKSRYYHGLIGDLDNQYADYDLEQYKKTLYDFEEGSGTYYGENLSSDSDSEQERHYQSLSHRKKSFTHDYTMNFFKKSGVENMLTKNGVNFKKSSSGNRDARQKLNYDVYQLTEEQQRDLDRLNYLAMTEELNEETLNTLSTQFYVAQYRGISYRIDEGNRSLRKFHRQLREEGQPQFSRAVIARGEYPSYAQYMQALQYHPDQYDAITHKILHIAKRVQIQLQQLAASGTITVQLIGKKPYSFHHALHALQDLYTKSYGEFHNYLSQYIEKFIKPLSDDTHLADIDELEDAIAHSVSSRYSPFVSTSDTPEHALRYAYGDKYYGTYKEQRLRPRWRQDGKIERPYSGKVYISLHEPLELATTSHHLPSLNNQGKVKIDIMTLAERETTFFGFIPSGKVISQHIAKYPSFKGAYKEIYFEKYGLSQDFYERFQERFIASKPHSSTRKDITRKLAEYLVHYQEVCLIEEAHIAARKRGGVLIYRNEFGGFSLYPCKTKEITRSNNTKRLGAARATTQLRQRKRQNRIISPATQKNFLENLLSNYVIIPSEPKSDSLESCLAYLLHEPIEKIKILRMASDKKKLHENVFLQKIAECYKTIICIHDPMVEGHARIIKPKSSPFEQEINLYAVGGSYFSALELKSSSLGSKSIAQPRRKSLKITGDQTISDKNNKRKQSTEPTSSANKTQKTTHEPTTVKSLATLIKTKTSINKDEKSIKKELDQAKWDNSRLHTDIMKLDKLKKETGAWAKKDIDDVRQRVKVLMNSTVKLAEWKKQLLTSQNTTQLLFQIEIVQTAIQKSLQETCIIYYNFATHINTQLNRLPSSDYQKAIDNIDDILGYFKWITELFPNIDGQKLKKDLEGKMKKGIPALCNKISIYFKVPPELFKQRKFAESAKVAHQLMTFLTHIKGLVASYASTDPQFRNLEIRIEKRIKIETEHHEKALEQHSEQAGTSEPAHGAVNVQESTLI